MVKVEITTDEGQMLIKLLEARKFTIEQPESQKLCADAHKKLLDALSGPGLNFGDDEDGDDDD